KAVEPALGHDQALSTQGQIADDLPGIGIEYRGAHGYWQYQIGGGAAAAIAAPPLLAIASAKGALVAVVDQGVEIGVGDQDHVATVATVATVGAAAGHIFFPPKAQAAVAALAGMDADGCFIDEFHGWTDAGVRGCGCRS